MGDSIVLVLLSTIPIIICIRKNSVVCMYIEYNKWWDDAYLGKEASAASLNTNATLCVICIIYFIVILHLYSQLYLSVTFGRKADEEQKQGREGWVQVTFLIDRDHQWLSTCMCMFLTRCYGDGRYFFFPFFFCLQLKNNRMPRNPQYYFWSTLPFVLLWFGVWSHNFEYI